MGEKNEIDEKRSLPFKGKTFMGYFLPTNSVVIAMIGIFGALICVLTMIIAIPIPATEGYINIGDAGVMITAILFGPVVGAIAGGVGSMTADIILAPHYAIPTLIIKGLEGFIVGLIANPKKNRKKLIYRDIIAVLVGGSIIVFGYFIYESIVYGPLNALIEIPGNIFQFVFAAVIAIIFSLTAKKNIIDNLPQVFDKIFIIED